MDSPIVWFPQICEATCEMPRLAALDVLDSLSDEAFSKEYAARSVPFLLRLGALKFSEAEILGLLQGAYGDQTVTVRFGNMADPGSYLNRREEEMPLRSFIGKHFMRINDAGTAYAAGTVIPVKMARDLGVPFPMFYTEYFFNEPRMWMGKKRTVTALHKDLPDNFSFASFGAKEWLLYPPADFPYLYMIHPRPNALPDFGVSMVNAKSPDATRFPEFSKATPISIMQRAGDLLYVPAGWSHFVENHEDSLMINFWLKRGRSPAVLGRDR